MGAKRLPKGMKLTVGIPTVAILYQTQIVKVEAGRITLDSGGWRTMHTKKCINLVFTKLGLDFTVFQKRGEWFLSGPNINTVPFQDDMSFDIGGN